MRNPSLVIKVDGGIFVSSDAGTIITPRKMVCAVVPFGPLSPVVAPLSLGAVTVSSV
jgi:hypothetical protein